MTQANRRSLRLEQLEAREVPAFLGELDPTFGTGGVATVPAGIADFGLPQAAVDPTGRTVVAGVSTAGGFAVARLTAAGALDTSFGSGGTATIPDPGALVSGVATDAGGDVFVVGKDDTGMVVLGLTPAGVLDAGFGAGGIVHVSYLADLSGLVGTAVTVDPVGDVVAAGVVIRPAAGGIPPQDGALVVRLTPAGVPDPAFNGGAPQFVDWPDFNPASVSVDGSGRIVIGGFDVVAVPDVIINGEPPPPPPSHFEAVRLTAGGAVDTSFATAGRYTAPGLGRGPVCVATDAAGDIFLSGPVGSVGTVGASGAVLKLTESGSPDPSFGTNGEFLSPPVFFSGSVSGLLVLPDGRLLLTGSTSDPRPVGSNGDTFVVCGVTADGHLDPAFNPGGPTPGVIVPEFGLGGDHRSVGIGLTPDGKIIVGGFDASRVVGDPTAGNAEAVRLFGTADGTGSNGGVGLAPVPLPPASDPPPVNPFASLGVAVRTATGDVDGDGVSDTIYVTGPGAPARVAVVSGKDNTTLLVPPFDPFGGDFTGGGFVAAADLDRDGAAEIIVTPDQGGGPRVVVLGLAAGSPVVRASFLGIDDPGFRGGARVAVGDVDGDGSPDLIVSAGSGGGPRTAVFDGATLMSAAPARLVPDFFAFPGADAESLRDGAFVAAGDVDGDGKADLVFGGGPGGAPRVFILSGALVAGGNVDAAYTAPIANFFAGGDSSGRGGAPVSVTPVGGG
ncbi:MAG TPA: hypothetical protein VH092_29450, partial [Urbifossiella sp.]|nr:hypothetical protein [Urbifossiella sp.]